MPNNPVVASYVADFLKPDQLHVFRQLRGLQRGADAHVFTHRRENAQRFPYDERLLHVLPKPRTRWWRRLVHTQLRQEPWQMYRWELRDWIQHLTRIEAQVLHIYFGHVAPQFLPLMKAWPHPVVVSFHGADAGLNMDKPRYREALQQVFKLATKVQSRSEALNEDLLRLGCSPDKLVLQRTGIPVENWKFRERQAPAEGAWHLMQSCRFIEKKGIDLTLKAFAVVAARYPKAKLTLVGDGPLRSVLELQARDLGIVDKVTFAGFLAPAEVLKAIAQTDIFLHPSRTGSNGDREGVPNAMLEAMTDGAPVVATRHGGIPEAIVDGESGLLVTENDAAGLAAATLRVMDDEALRLRLGRGGRAAVEQKFSRTAQDKNLIAFYKSLLPAP